MEITMRAEARQRSLASIKRYFAEELDHKIGDLKADLHGACFVPEFAYWSTPPRRPAE